MDKIKSETGYDISPMAKERREVLAQDLTREEYDVLLNHGTEPAFCGNLTDNKEDGVYACRLCGLPLFKSDAKFNSRTGWASFYDTFDPEHITEIRDVSYGQNRNSLQALRRTSRTRFRRWTKTDRFTLLFELCIVGIFWYRRCRTSKVITSALLNYYFPFKHTHSTRE
jgi:methionine-R-sulfoxide reductase